MNSAKLIGMNNDEIASIMIERVEQLLTGLSRITVIVMPLLVAVLSLVIPEGFADEEFGLAERVPVLGIEIRPHGAGAILSILFAFVAFQLGYSFKLIAQVLDAIPEKRKEIALRIRTHSWILNPFAGNIGGWKSIGYGARPFFSFLIISGVYSACYLGSVATLGIALENQYGDVVMKVWITCWTTVCIALAGVFIFNVFRVRKQCEVPRVTFTIMLWLGIVGGYMIGILGSYFIFLPLDDFLK